MPIEHRVRESLDAYMARVRHDMDAHLRSLTSDLMRLVSEIHGDGEQTRCFCHVQDTIRALSGLMERGLSGEIYTVGSEERISINGLARRVLDVTGSSSELEYVSYEDVYGIGIEDMLHRIPSIAKIGEATGWKPERTLDDILADVIAFERSKVEAAA